MLKAADALAGAGYRVRVVSTRYVGWADAADLDVRRSREGAWEWSAVDYDRHRARARYLRTGLRSRAALGVAGVLGAPHCPFAAVVRAQGRVHPELLRAALARPADLFYGGTAGALAAAALAGARAGVPYALDLEDFHSAERDEDGTAALAHGLAERIERALLPGAALLTAGSAAIASAYAEKYGVRPVAIHNTFPLPARPPDPVPGPGDGLKLYWFSQTIGSGRGLEDAVHAMGLAAVTGELHLRGRAIPQYLDAVRRLAAEAAPRLTVIHHEPAPPDAMVDLCRGYDVGLSLEQGHVQNHALCLGNKALTYVLAGLAIVLTATPGQQPLAADLGEGALVYAPGDVATLAKGLRRWADDRAMLARARAAAWRAARERWHWEHRDERGALLAAVSGIVR